MKPRKSKENDLFREVVGEEGGGLSAEPPVNDVPLLLKNLKQKVIVQRSTEWQKRATASF